MSNRSDGNIWHDVSIQFRKCERNLISEKSGCARCPMTRVASLFGKEYCHLRHRPGQSHHRSSNAS